MSEPTRNIKLYGTDQPIVEPRVLKAGALSAELEAGNLRHIRLGGVEVIRAISYRFCRNKLAAGAGDLSRS